MARKCRVLQKGLCEITNYFGNGHGGLDLVGANYTIDNIVAHSDGTVVAYRKDYNKTDKSGGSYGNYVKIKHDDGYYTLYAHIKYNTVTVKTGDRVKRGQMLGVMGNTGYSKGIHLHWEVRNTNDVKINPLPYLDADLPKNDKVNVYYKVRTKEDGWLPEVKNLDDYAGEGKHTIIDFMVRVDKGSVWYQAHIKGGRWLPKVTGYNEKDFYNGYAGESKPIDCVRIYYNDSNKKAKYRINNLPWVYNTQKCPNGDDFAGNIGENAYKLEITIE